MSTRKCFEDPTNCIRHARAILLVFEKFTRAHIFQITLKIMWLSAYIRTKTNEISDLDYTGKTGARPQYGSFIFRIFFRIFPYYGIEQIYENWILQPFLIVFPKFFHTMEDYKNMNSLQ